MLPAFRNASSDSPSVVEILSDAVISQLSEHSLEGIAAIPQRLTSPLSPDNRVNAYLNAWASPKMTITTATDNIFTSFNSAGVRRTSDPLVGDSQVGEMDRLTRSHKPSRSNTKKTYRFGRLFPSLEPFETMDETLLLMGAPSDDAQNPAFMLRSCTRKNVLPKTLHYPP